MEKEILQNNFEAVYKEYKDYKDYIEATANEVQSQREAFQQRVVSGGDSDDVLLSALFDLSIKPIQEKVDLEHLKNRLVTVYDAYKILLDFPDNIKEEMSLLSRPTMTYIISNGKQTEVNKELNDKLREEARYRHIEAVKSIREQ